jgi:cyclic lactone autoinducer peptide
MKSALLNKTVIFISSVLVGIAGLSAILSSFLFFYEPDCPEELLNE